MNFLLDTPGNRVGPGGRDQTLAVKSIKKSSKISFFLLKKKFPKRKYFLHISFSYAKILGETNFQPREISPSGSKAKDGEIEKEDRKLEIINVQLRIATPPRVTHSKPPEPKERK